MGLRSECFLGGWRGKKITPGRKGEREREATLIVNEPESEGTQEKAKSILQQEWGCFLLKAVLL